VREIRTLRSSGDGKRGDAEWPEPPRPSSTLPCSGLSRAGRDRKPNNNRPLPEMYEDLARIVAMVRGGPLRKRMVIHRPGLAQVTRDTTRLKSLKIGAPKTAIIREQQKSKTRSLILDSHHSFRQASQLRG
jgi:hypothetical protein